MTLEDMYHFRPLTERLLTGGMPTAGQLADAAEDGVQVVINLAIPDSDRALPGEQSIVESLGMQYVGIPVQWDAPTGRDLDQFMDAMDAHAEHKLLVHCQANFRVSGFVMLYRVLRLGWRPEDAFKDLLPIWDPEDYPVWKKFIDDNLPSGGRRHRT